MTAVEKTKITEMKALLRTLADLPEDQAVSLPGKFYTDPDYFTYEVETFLSREWHCLGRADEIPQPGDYFTTQLFNEPLLIVRTDDRRVQVLSNICRHRGMQLVTGAGSKRSFVCSYHAWRYARDGKLMSAPHMDIALKGLADCRLPAFNAEVSNGFIYACLDPNAAPLSPRLEKLNALLANYRPADMRIVRTFEEEWRTNWKCLIENFIESYHLSVVHPKTLHPYTPTRLSRKALSDPNFTAYCANYPDHADQRGMGSPDMDQDERRRSTLFSFFPTQIASQAATLLVSFSVQPVAVDRVHIRWTLSTYAHELSDADLEDRIALWLAVNEEDRDKLERLQVGLSSRHATSGRLAHSDFEGTIRDFYRYLARQNATGPAP